MVRYVETYRGTKFIRNTSTFWWAGNLAGAHFQSQLANRPFEMAAQRMAMPEKVLSDIGQYTIKAQ